MNEEKPENLVCMAHVINLHDNLDPAAWDRIWSAFIAGVEAEGGSAAGGMHAARSNPMCGWCAPATVCFECGKELEDE